MTVLGLDVGTTAAKATVFDAAGERLDHAEIVYPDMDPAAQDPEVVVDAAMRAMQQVEASTVSCCTAMHGLVALDEHDKPLTPLLTWADTRAADQAERLKREHPDLHDRTGTPLHPMSPLTKLVWFREREPEIHAAARRWVGLKELVLHRLTGRWVVDWSVASGTGLLDLATLDWCPEALELAGVERSQLAELVAPTDLVGEGVIAGAGDGPLANLGVGAVRPGVAACSIGTSGALRLMVERPAIDPMRRLFCYALTKDRWAIGGAINNGGVVLEWAHEALAPELTVAELLDVASTAPPGSDGLLMAPYLLAERGPHWDVRATGAYIGLRRRHGRAHLVRAALEGVCQQLNLVLESLEAAGQQVREIRATGGFARSAFWRQLLADVLGRPIGFPERREGSGFGAALLGLKALGEIESLDAAIGRLRIAEVVEPDPQAAAIYRDILSTWPWRSSSTTSSSPSAAGGSSKAPRSRSPRASGSA
ncbi:MAG: carbohydrate kinase [Actinobacteria bacterium]|nr:MAG: carbohydrate kinase [Actinomycetota bacterium]